MDKLDSRMKLSYVGTDKRILMSSMSLFVISQTKHDLNSILNYHAMHYFKTFFENF